MASPKPSNPEPSLLRRPNAITNQDRLTSFHVEESTEKQQSTRSTQPNPSKASLKRSNSSNVEQAEGSLTKPHPPTKRPAVQSVDVKSEVPTRMTTRSVALKNKSCDSVDSSIRQDKKIPSARSTASSLPKSSAAKVSKNTTAPAAVPGNKNIRTPETPSSARMNGTAASKIRSIPSATVTQAPKSLKDHLVEIRANASLRKSSETTVPAASQSQKSSKPSTSVTSASISLRRTNSLIPKSNRASTVVAAAAASQALAEKEAEILALKQHLDTSSSQWKKIFDTFCIFSQWSLNKKDQQLEKASRREKELKERVKALSEECAQVKTDMEQLLQQHTKSQADHTKAWEMERLTLESEINTLRANLQTEKEKEIEKIRLQCDADISELQKAYDAQLTEERRVWASRVAESRNKLSAQLDQQQIDHETQIAELKRHNAARVSEIEGHLKSRESELLAKLASLQSECNELRKAAENCVRVSPELQNQIPSSTQPSMCDFSVQMPSSPEEEKEFLLAKKAQEEQEQLQQQQPQPTPSFNFDDIPISMARSCYMPPTKPLQASFFSPAPLRQKTLDTSIPSTDDSNMQEEIESLKTVLELKSVENADLRQKTMQLEEQLASAKDLNREIKELQKRNENLEALLELRAESQKQLQDRYQGMFQSLDKEIKEKKKFKMECESLRFKLLDAHHKIEQMNAANASEDDSASMTDSLYMARSVCSDARVISSNFVIGADVHPCRPISETLEASTTETDDRLPAGSFIALDTRPVSSSSRARRGLQHDRSKRRTLATSDELQRRS